MIFIPILTALHCTAAIPLIWGENEPTSPKEMENALLTTPKDAVTDPQVVFETLWNNAGVQALLKSLNTWAQNRASYQTIVLPKELQFENHSTYAAIFSLLFPLNHASAKQSGDPLQHTTSDNLHNISAFHAFLLENDLFCTAMLLMKMMIEQSPFTPLWLTRPSGHFCLKDYFGAICNNRILFTLPNKIDKDICKISVHDRSYIGLVNFVINHDMMNHLKFILYAHWISQPLLPDQTSSQSLIFKEAVRLMHNDWKADAPHLHHLLADIPNHQRNLLLTFCVTHESVWPFPAPLTFVSVYTPEIMSFVLQDGACNEENSDIVKNHFAKWMHGQITLTTKILSTAESAQKTLQHYLPHRQDINPESISFNDVYDILMELYSMSQISLSFIVNRRPSSEVMKTLGQRYRIRLLLNDNVSCILYSVDSNFLSDRIFSDEIYIVFPRKENALKMLRFLTKSAEHFIHWMHACGSTVSAGSSENFRGQNLPHIMASCFVRAMLFPPKPFKKSHQ